MSIPIKGANVWIKTIRFLLVVGIAVLGLLAAAGPVQALKIGGSGVDQRYCGPDPKYPSVTVGIKGAKCSAGPGKPCTLVRSTGTVYCNKNTCEGDLPVWTVILPGECNSQGYCVGTTSNPLKLELKYSECWVHCKNVCSQKKENWCTRNQRKYTFNRCVGGVPSGACEKPWCVADKK